MTLAFAFSHENKIYCAIDRCSWIDNYFFLEDKYIIPENNKRIILGSGSARACMEIGAFLNKKLEEAETMDDFPSSFLSKNQSILWDSPEIEKMQKTALDQDYNGLIIENNQIYLIDQYLTLFPIKQRHAIGLQKEACKALIDALTQYSKISPFDIMLTIFDILNKIDIFVPSSLSENISLFEVDKNKLTVLKHFNLRNNYK